MLRALQAAHDLVLDVVRGESTPGGPLSTPRVPVSAARPWSLLEREAASAERRAEALIAAAEAEESAAADIVDLAAAGLVDTPRVINLDVAAAPGVPPAAQASVAPLSSFLSPELAMERDTTRTPLPTPAPDTSSSSGGSRLTASSSRSRSSERQAFPLSAARLSRGVKRSPAKAAAVAAAAMPRGAALLATAGAPARAHSVEHANAPSDAVRRCQDSAALTSALTSLRARHAELLDPLRNAMQRPPAPDETMPDAARSPASAAPPSAIDLLCLTHVAPRRLRRGGAAL
jgi:hypothetical protein